ncbi:amino acid transporter [Boletus edulis]|nr:amino acid transporter [Boletus edulis]
MSASLWRRFRKAENDEEVTQAVDVGPGGLSFEEDTAGGLGRHLGITSCTLLVVGYIIGSGIFSTPSSILSGVGSVGASLMLWVLGFVLSFLVGEKVYLEAIYTTPKYFATVIFAANAILLGFSAGGCIVFASNILVSAGNVATNWSVRGIALGVIFFVTILHGFTPRIGVYVMNALSIFKIVILIFVVITGWIVLSGKTHIANPEANFTNAFAGSSHNSGDYATATFKVLYAYSGWQASNYVLNNVRNPVQTLKIAGPLGLGALGNVIAATFSAARINQELAKEGIPLPFGNKFWASNWPTGKAPLPGLIVHLIPSIIVILGPPMNVAYPFILDIQGYPAQIINFFIIIGLFWMRWKRPDIPRPFKVWLPLAVFYLAATLFREYFIVAPFLPPANGVGDTPPLPYYLYCLVGIGVMFFGVGYWAWWRVLLPKVFGYELVPRKETLEDGTVVILFSRNKL